MRIIALIVIVQSLLSFDAHADNVYVQGQWANGPQVVYMLFVLHVLVCRHALATGVGTCEVSCERVLHGTRLHKQKEPEDNQALKKAY